MNLTSTDPMVILGGQGTGATRVGSTAPVISSQFGLINVSQNRAPPPDAPQWAKIINDCEVRIETLWLLSEIYNSTSLTLLPTYTLTGK